MGNDPLPLLASVSLKIVNDVLDGDKSAHVGIVDLDVELLFAMANEIGKINRTDSKILRKLGLGGDVGGVDK